MIFDVYAGVDGIGYGIHVPDMVPNVFVSSSKAQKEYLIHNPSTWK